MGIYVFKKDVLTKLLGDKYPQVITDRVPLHSRIGSALRWQGRRDIHSMGS